MEITEYDNQVASQIWWLLKSNLPVMLSWGIEPNSIKTVTLGTTFHVQGFKHKGNVTVTLDEGNDLYEVTLVADDTSKPQQKLTDIYVDQLVDILDREIERVDNYEERVIAGLYSAK